MAELRVGLVQFAAADAVSDNIARGLLMIREAIRRGASFVALPEWMLYRGPREGLLAAAEAIPGRLTAPFEALAREHRVAILLGSIPERSPDPERPYNTSVLIGRDGVVAATYRKIHLFDVTVDERTSDRESARTTSGDRAVVAELDGLRVGMTVCYDLRFPELFRALVDGGAQVITVPAVFAERTGRDHWEVLLRARAIENEVFVVAPAAWGTVGAGTAFGRSMVVDPWGTIVAQAPDGPGVIVADLDLARVATVRRQIPVHEHRRPDAYRLG